MARAAAGPVEPAESPAARRIVAAARRHFFAHGFRGVSMDDLAAELGMSKKTLYAHFPSKDALVRAAILEKLAELDGELGQILSACRADFLAALHRLLACMERHVGEIQPPFVRDVRREAPELFQQVEGRRAEVIERHFGRLFAEGRRRGMVRTDVPARLAIETLLGAVRAVVNPETVARLKVTPKAAYSAVIAIVLEGLLTPAGRSGP